jgi:hypothetical protein
MRRRKRDTSIMTCSMSPSKRALLAQREVAVTVGYWLARNDAKNSRFFRGSGRRRKHDTHPADARMHRACREGSWEGGGSLVGAGGSVVPWGGDATCHDGNCTMVWCNLLYFRRCGVIFTTGKKRIAIMAPQWHGEVLPPCHCGARIVSLT